MLLDGGFIVQFRNKLLFELVVEEWEWNEEDCGNAGVDWESTRY